MATISLYSQGTAFTYQGELKHGNSPANGRYDLLFSVWDASSAGNRVGAFMTNSATMVGNGLFNVILDFGPVFDGNARWIEIAVRTNGDDTFVALAPRQPMTAAPYAIHAGGVNATGITGAITASMLAPNAAAANLAAGAQSAVPGGGMILSANPDASNLTSAGYVRLGGQLDMSWQQLRSDTPRTGHTAIWTGDKMIVWGGEVQPCAGCPPADTSYSLNGAVFDVTSNRWFAVTLTNAPRRRSKHTAVWAGSVMIVWGGSYVAGGGQTYYENTGGRYDPLLDAWSVTTTTNAPSKRDQQTAIWTGKEMIIWGGQVYNFPKLTAFGDGARYDPKADGWIQMATNGAPKGRFAHTAVWTGNEMLIWGGRSDTSLLNDGARYDPTADTWSPITTNGAPAARFMHDAIWTGSEMLIWGGDGDGSHFDDGGRYNPSTDTWSPLPSNGSPGPLAIHTTVWTGNEMIVWGGYFQGYSECGASYDPVANKWSAVPTISSPGVRSGFTAIWTGNEMLVFGGTLGDTAGSTYLGEIYAYTPSRVMYLYLRSP